MCQNKKEHGRINERVLLDSFLFFATALKKQLSIFYCPGNMTGDRYGADSGERIHPK